MNGAGHRLKLLVFAHVPPPMHGQSLMVQQLVNGLVHVEGSGDILCEHVDDVLRPLLAARWVEGKRSAAPIEFDTLLTLLSNQPEVLAAIQSLLVQKRSTPELGMAPAVPVLNEFIEAELKQEIHDVPKKSRSPMVVDLLNEMFHSALREHLERCAERGLY